ncbi:flavanone 3-dioxygenase 3-like [Morus notabilis]|uniref:flavanone 3-dioxygenase 3-like n=1 Tax=Morus notabilis TaxID=981085 RepID=UPI000CED6372|nr:flavanone 3-dioxygenase 3-like [Morus notabilis]
MPTISLNDLISHNSQTRSIVVEKLHQACKEMGFFQITNHGISKRVIEDALGSSMKFFDLPIEEKNAFSSEDVFRPVRYAPIRSNDLSGGRFHSLPMEEMVEPALELFDKENPKKYRASSLSDYIK